MLNTIEELFSYKPFELTQEQKDTFLQKFYNNLTNFHYENSDEYRQILSILTYDTKKEYKIAELPFLPVRLFKELELKSTQDIFKTMSSSGTSSSNTSKIFLDKTTALNQTKVLTKIVNDFIGSKRLPMIILDTKSVLKNPKEFSARGSGIIGFSIFARDRIFAFDENMNLNIQAIEAFLEKHKGKEILLFGFTFMVWQYFYHTLKKSTTTLDLSNGILIHGGGWKKLIDSSVDDALFKSSLKEICGIKKVYNYYGMVEQTGSIFMQCDAGHFHTSIYSDIIIRDENFNICNLNQEGMIQLISTLPNSYPGHNILSEDIGKIIGVDDCPCGRKGKYFTIKGRIKKAQIRGCSDTFTS